LNQSRGWVKVTYAAANMAEIDETIRANEEGEEGFVE
jgi:hypothetical protein